MPAAPYVVDHFEILEPVAEGGMGTVYRARDVRDGGAIALKVLDRTSNEAAARFDREARLLPTLIHPGIVRYVTHGRTDAGKPYIAMEWLYGEDLGVRLMRQGLNAQEAIDLVRQVAVALGVAHRVGVVHRDIKPSNLFLVNGDPATVKVLDFGVARWTSDAKLTIPGTVAGTPGYMAPEVVRGSAAVDARADVFSLGCVLFECLTGRPAFLGDTPIAVLANVLLSDPPPLRELVDVPPELDELANRMLARSPEDRPTDGDELARALEAQSVREGARPNPMLPRRTFLTHGERRLLAVVLARPAGEAPLLLAADIQRVGGNLAVLHDGSLVVVLEAGAAATDLAAKAAHIGIRVKEVVPSAVIGIATGRSEIGFLWPASELIDRAAFLVEQAAASPSDCIARVDGVSAGLLEGRFMLGSDATGTSLLGELPVLPGRKLLGRAMPCLGRQRELDLLLELFSESVSEGCAKAVIITGAPGVGKSKLCQELLARADEIAPHATWLARGARLGAGAALGTLAEIARHAFGIERGEEEAARRAKISRAIEAAIEEPLRDRVCTGISSLLGLSPLDLEPGWLQAPLSDPTALGDLMSFAWDELLRAQLSRQPVVVVIDDADDADASTLEYLNRSLRRASDAPLFVILVSRGGLLKTPRRLWEGRDVTRMTVGELPESAAHELCSLALGDAITVEASSDLVKLAAGNAFYLEELIRAVARQGDAELPGTVRAMVLARLEALPIELRRALRAASLYGDSFRAEGVSRLLEGVEALPPSEVLRQLEAEELIERVWGETSDSGQAAWAFRHAVVREVAYEMLTDEDRVIAHALAADWLASTVESEPRTIAWHFEQSSEPGRAGPWWQRATVRALEANELEAVSYCAERARDCGVTGTDLGVLYRLEAEAARWRGRFAHALELATKAMDALPEGHASWWIAASEVAVAANATSEHDRIGPLVETLERALERHPILTVPPVLALSRAARNARFAGRFDLAERLDGHLVQVSQSAVASIPLAAARLAEAEAERAHFAGDPAGCLAARLRAVNAFEKGGDARACCHNRANAGYDYLVAGALGPAATLLGQARDEALRLGLANIAAAAAHNLGLVLLHLGDIDRALRLETEAAAGYEELGSARMHSASRIYLARIHLAAEHLDEAQREARAAISSLSRSPIILAYAEGVLAQILLEKGATTDALEWAERAHTRLTSVGHADEGGALIRLVRARAWRAAGDEVRAAEAILKAREALLEAAAGMMTPEDRECFLTAIPEHRETIRLAREWLGGASRETPGA